MSPQLRRALGVLVFPVLLLGSMISQIGPPDPRELSDFFGVRLVQLVAGGQATHAGKNTWEGPGECIL